MQKSLYNAIVTKLRTDTGAGSLVDLTKHGQGADKNIRIARDNPQVKDRTPFLGVYVYQSVPLIGADVTQIQSAFVYFRVYARDEVVGIEILDRLEYLIHAEGSNLSYYNFSDLNISNRETRFKSRMGPKFDQETEVWTGQIGVNLIWSNKKCP